MTAWGVVSNGEGLEFLFLSWLNTVGTCMTADFQTWSRKDRANIHPQMILRRSTPPNIYSSAVKLVFSTEYTVEIA